MSHNFSGTAYSAIRLLLGAYLFVHFAQLMPYGTELFSNAGALPNASLSPLFGVLPNPLQLSDDPIMVGTILIFGVGASLLLAAGIWHRVGSVLAALCLAWIYARNPLIANPSMPVIGWLLIAHLFVPPKPYGALAFRKQPDVSVEWKMPAAVFHAAWIMLAFWYSYSGLTKLMSPSWVDGTAVSYVLDNPLARSHFLRDFLLALPSGCLQLLTWVILYIEILFVPLALFRRLRPWVWGAMLMIQLGFLTFLNFADLTFPMLLLHMLTFDMRWIPSSFLISSRLCIDREEL